MLVLHQFPGPWDVISGSCFCGKVEAFMRWQGIAYDKVSKVSLKGAPKGKVPFIIDDGKAIGDSEFIIAYLCKKHNLRPDAALTPEQQGISRAVRYMCEEGIYRAMSYFRFVDDAGWAITRDVFFEGLPGWLRPVAEWKVRGYVRQQLQQQGIGRHSPEDIGKLAEDDLIALADLIGAKPFLFGSEMHLADIVIFSVVSNLIQAPYDNAASRKARALPVLVAHSDRVRQACFGQQRAAA